MRWGAPDLWVTLPLWLTGAHFPEGSPLEQEALDVRLSVWGPFSLLVVGTPLHCEGIIRARRSERASARGRLRLTTEKTGKRYRFECDLGFTDAEGNRARLVVADRVGGVLSLTRFRGRLHYCRAVRQAELRADWRQLGSMVRATRISGGPPSREG